MVATNSPVRGIFRNLSSCNRISSASLMQKQGLASKEEKLTVPRSFRNLQWYCQTESALCPTPSGSCWMNYLISQSLYYQTVFMFPLISEGWQLCWAWNCGSEESFLVTSHTWGVCTWDLHTLLSLQEAVSRRVSVKILLLLFWKICFKGFKAYCNAAPRKG